MWQAFTTYFREHRRAYAVGLVALVIVDLLDLLPPLILKWGIDALTDKLPARLIGGIALAYLGVVGAQGLFRYQWRIRFQGSAHRIDRSLKAALFRKMVRLPLHDFHEMTTGHLIALASNDVQAIKQAMGIGLLIFFDAVLYCLTIPVLMFGLSPRVTVMCLAILPAVPFFVYHVGRIIDLKFGRLQEGFSVLSERVHENVAGARVVKACGLATAETERFREACDEYRRRGLSLARTEAYFSPILEFAAGIGAAIVLMVGGLDVMKGALTLGAFVALKSYVGKMTWPMMAFGWSFSMFKEASASQKRVDEIMARPSEAAASDGVEDVTGRSVEIRRLSFTYPGSNRPAISDLSLELRSPMRVAVVGPIGAGKSTLVHVLTRLYDPPAGTVFVDGRDVRDLPLGALRRCAAVVPQEPNIFAETIRENILLGADGSGGGALGIDLRALAEAAAVHDEIEALPGQYEAVLGERGVNLSGGQRKRVAIARALAKPAPILVLDDPFSAVDHATENRIAEAIRGLHQYGLILLITHRLVSVRWADRILVMDQGRLVEQGRHEELLERGGLYARLYREQEWLTSVESGAPEGVPAGAAS
ncbi:MAG: ABC transporter ATP-binding protein [Nitrospirae bacterium]|nr:ABC transporter ATP-binding protein [Nitrospirota bacterium]